MVPHSSDTLLVFDLDDTLYLEEDFVRGGFRAVETHLRRPQPGFYDIAWSLFQSGVRGDIFNRALDRMNIPANPELLRELVHVYRSHARDIQLTEDAEHCLSSIRGRVDLGIITDGPSIAQWNKLRLLGLTDVVKDIVVTEDLGPGAGKPSPLAFRKVQGERPGAACVYVADNPTKDFQAPKALGWKSIRIRRPRGFHADKPDDPGATADFHLSDLTEVPALLHL